MGRKIEGLKTTSYEIMSVFQYLNEKTLWMQILSTVGDVWRPLKILLVLYFQVKYNHFKTVEK